MTDFYASAFKAAVAAVLICGANAVSAEDRDTPLSFLDRMFKGEDHAPTPDAPQQLAQNTPSDLVVRIDRLEAQIRQLTGIIEQLQYRNQQLEAQLGRMQQGAGPQSPAVPGRPGMAAGMPLPPPAAGSTLPPPSAQAQASAPGRRPDVFDPLQNPNAPGVPRTLGTLPGGPSEPGQGTYPGGIADEPPIGAPGGRAAGAPLDLTPLSPTGSSQAAIDPTTPQSSPLPPPPARNPSSTGVTTGAVASVLPPSATPRDQYDLGYGYVLHKDYALAEDAFQTFLTRYPKDKLAPDAQFWLGESRFQRQRYDAAAEAFLAVSTKHSSNPKAPEAMLRLGQSLAQMGQREMACATLAEIGRKFPRASAGVRQGVDREQKRVKC